MLQVYSRTNYCRWENESMPIRKVTHLCNFKDYSITVIMDVISEAKRNTKLLIPVDLWALPSHWVARHAKGTRTYKRETRIPNTWEDFFHICSPRKVENLTEKKIVWPGKSYSAEDYIGPALSAPRKGLEHKLVITKPELTTKLLTSCHGFTDQDQDLPKGNAHHMHRSSSAHLNNHHRWFI